MMRRLMASLVLPALGGWIGADGEERGVEGLLSGGKAVKELQSGER